MSPSFSISFAQEIWANEHWLFPTDLVAHLGIQPGMTVAEMRAGTGFYALPIGRAVGPAGSVYAIEWRPRLVDELRNRISDPGGLDNVKPVVGHPAETQVPEACCDLVILADMWHELEHPEAALDEARRILRAEGRLAILNWRPDAPCPPGPPIEHRISMQKTICTVELKSWSLVKAAEIGAHGYLLVFEMTNESVQS